MNHPGSQTRHQTKLILLPDTATTRTTTPEWILPKWDHGTFVTSDTFLAK